MVTEKTRSSRTSKIISLKLEEGEIVSPFSARSRFNENARRLVANIFQGTGLSLTEEISSSVSKKVSRILKGESVLWNAWKFFVRKFNFVGNLAFYQRFEWINRTQNILCIKQKF